MLTATANVFGEFIPNVSKLRVDHLNIVEVPFCLVVEVSNLSLDFTDSVPDFVDLLFILVTEHSIIRIPQPVQETFFVNSPLDFQLEVILSDETIDRSFIVVGHFICILE